MADNTKSIASQAGDLRESKKNNTENPNTNATPSLREATMSAKRQEKSNEDKKGTTGGAGAAAMRKGTSSLLRSAWSYLVPSWGLTVIWINIHVLLGKVLGNKLFCKLGEEWADISGAKAAAGGENQVIKKAGKAINTYESIGLGCINLGCFVVLISFLAIITLIFEGIQNPLRTGIRFLNLDEGIFSWINRDNK